MGFWGINVDQLMSSLLQTEMIGNIQIPYLQCFIICMEYLSPVFILPAFVSFYNSDILKNFLGKMSLIQIIFCVFSSV